MKITTDMLTAWGACREGMAWFADHFPAGEAEYQTIGNKRVDDAQIVRQFVSKGLG